MKRVLLACILVACNSSAAAVDAGDDASISNADASLDADAHADVVDPDACATCQSLTALCAADASAFSPLPCPPALDSPDFDAWARDRFSKQSFPAIPVCGSLEHCPETVTILFNNGTDCVLEYIFDANTKKLVGVESTCNGLIGCVAADTCVPFRCVDNGSGMYDASAVCPPMPDAGLSDASLD